MEEQINKKMIRKIKKKSYLSIFIIILALIISGIIALNLVFAYYNTTSNHTNIFRSGKYKIIVDNGGGEFKQTHLDLTGVKTTLPTPERKGYTFMGYSLTDGGSIAYKNDVPDITKLNDKKIWVIWKVNIYTITYDLNKGTGSTNPAIKNAPAKYTVEDKITIPNPTRVGYTFAGWTGTGLKSATKDLVIPKGSIDNRKYTATWTPHTLSVTNYDRSTKIRDKSVIYYFDDSNESKDLQVNGLLDVTRKENWQKDGKWGYLLTRTGYKLTGKWLIGSATSTNKVDDHDKFNSPQELADSLGYNIDNESKSVNLYAEWTPVIYTITYNLDGGTNNSANPKTFTIESNKITLQDPTKEGYIFAGWTGSNGTAASKNVIIPTGTIDNKTYTAHWQITNFTVSFNGNGGTDGGSITKLYNTEIGNLPSSTRRGYNFNNWWTTQNGGTQITSKTLMPGKDTTYFAHWNLINYRINYNLNGGTVSGQPTSYNVESNRFCIPNASRGTWTFDGWSGSNTCIDKGTIGELNYSANWSDHVAPVITGVWQGYYNASESHINFSFTENESGIDKCHSTYLNNSGKLWDSNWTSCDELYDGTGSFHWTYIRFAGTRKATLQVKDHYGNVSNTVEIWITNG